MKEEKRGGKGMEGGVLECGRLRKQGQGILGGVKDWDVVIMIEIWWDKSKWDRYKKDLPKGYIWVRQGATRRNKKGRTMGGMIMRIRKELVGEEGGIEERGRE